MWWKILEEYVLFHYVTKSFVTSYALYRMVQDYYNAVDYNHIIKHLGVLVSVATW